MLLVFDFDGTLVDSLHDLAESASELAQAYGGRALDDAAVSQMIGDGAGVLVQRVLAASEFPEPPAGALERFLAIYDRRMLDHTRPYPGMTSTLTALAERHALALLTNKPAAASKLILDHTDLSRFFRHRVFGDDELPRKPDPEGLRWLMARNGASPERALLIGDSSVDLDTARAAGVRLCLARYGFGFAGIAAERLLPGDLQIDEPAELVRLLDDGYLRNGPSQDA